MKYTTEIEINKPINEVVELFENPDNYKKWMEGFVSYKCVEGTKGKEGSKAEITFQMGKKTMELTEVIVLKKLPEKQISKYKSKNVLNNQFTKFTAISDTKTNYTTENEFVFKGIMKAIGFLMPNAFKKQSLKYMTDFKNFVENQ